MTEIEPVDVQQIAEEFPNSRFKITNVAILNPGICLVCRSAGGDGRQFVDFGKTVDFYGVVYVCTFCVAEVAQILGFTNNNEQIVAAHNETVQLYNGLLKTSQEMENAFRTILRNCHCELVIDLQPGTLVDVEADPESDETESDSDESGDVEGPDDVSDSSDDDESAPAPRRRRSTKSVE